MDILLNGDRIDTAYIRDDRGRLVRITPLKKREFARLASNPRGIAPGASRREWENTQEGTAASVVAGDQWQPGGVVLRANGSIRILIAREVIDGELVESIVQFERDEWSGKVPKVTVAPEVIARMKHGSRYTVLAVRAGVLTLA